MAMGWVSIHRSIQDNPMWTEERFTKAQAWIDLILTANHEKNKVMLGFKILDVNRGQMVTSQVKLAKRWGWTRLTVNKFLRTLKFQRMISFYTDRTIQQGKTVITITNYDKYQSREQQELQQGLQQGYSKSYTNNNVNNENNVNKRERAHSNNFSERKSITDKVIGEIAISYKVSDEFVKDCWDSAINWCNAKGKIQKDYKAFLSNWVKREKASMILKNKNTPSMLRREPKDIKFDRFGNPIGGTK